MLLGLVLMGSWAIDRVTQPDLRSGTRFTDKDSDHYILQSLMKIDASVEVKVPQLKKKTNTQTKPTKHKPHKEKTFYMLKEK